jgi:lysophospholipase L1-like esterase
VSILALGDSYTIGEGVNEPERWPVLLAAALRAEGLEVEAPQIIAQTGWTTADLAEAMAQENPQGPYTLVTLLIGVNNQYRGLPVESYESEFRTLLQQAIDLAGGEVKHVIVLSIPDWSATLYGANFSGYPISAEIDLFNETNQRISQEAGVNYVDITPITRSDSSVPGMLVSDGLHPSGQMYSKWVSLVLPVALSVLGE